MSGLSSEQLTQAVDRLAQCWATTESSSQLPDTTRNRLVSGLAKNDGGHVVQLDIIKAKEELLRKAQDVEEFQAAYQRLSNHANERDHFVHLLWKIAENPALSSALARGSQSPENKGIHANTLGGDTIARGHSTDRYGLKVGISMSSTELPPATPRTLETAHFLSLDSPSEDSTQPQNSFRTPEVTNRMHNNPFYFDTVDSHASVPPSAVPLRADYHRRLADEAAGEMPSRNFEPSVTLPDAGSLFRPMPDVIASSAPEHMQDVVRTRCMPEWNVHRPYLTGDFLLQAAQKAERAQPQVPLHGKSEAEQELLLVDDVLYAFLGLETTYLNVRKARGPGGNVHLVYVLSREHCQCCSRYLQEQVLRLLPIAECVVLIDRFVESRLAFEFGTVCHAFAAAVRILMDDWKLLIPSLEHHVLFGNARLHTLWFYCQPALSVLQLVAGVCAQCAADNLCGAALLDVLHSRAMQLAGNVAAARILQRLLHAATVPYFEMLTSWVARGDLNDPYGEFMVVEDASVDINDAGGGDAFWQNRYALRQRSDPDNGSTQEPEVPLFLQRVADIVLKAGKYWGVLRHCSELSAAEGAPEVIDYDPHGRYLQAVTHHYNAASAALMSMLLHTCQLRSWLQTMKSFFLLNQSDYVTNFLDAAQDELVKSAASVSQTRLLNLLELSVKTSSLAKDPYHEALRLSLDAKSFTELHSALFDKHRRKAASRFVGLDHLEAQELIMVTMKLPSPIMIVLQAWEMRAYEFLFKHLFSSKSVERLLCTTWSSLALVRTLRLTRPEERQAQRVLLKALMLCHHMLFFVQRYLHFITVEVIDPQWHLMTCRIESATSADEVIRYHHECLVKILRFGLLERMKALSTIAIIMWNCREFCWLIHDALRDATRKSGAGPRAHASDRHGREVLLQMASEKRFIKKINSRQDSFKEAMAKLIKELKDHKYKILSQGGEASDQHTRDSNREEADMIQNFVDQFASREVDAVEAALKEARSL